MVKRAAAALLWFYAAAWACNFFTVFAGISPVIGIGVAAIVGLFVGLDPLALIWPRRAQSPRRVSEVVSASAVMPGQI